MRPASLTLAGATIDGKSIVSLNVETAVRCKNSVVSRGRPAQSRGKKQKKAVRQGTIWEIWVYREERKDEAGTDSITDGADEVGTMPAIGHCHRKWWLQSAKGLRIVMRHFVLMLAVVTFVVQRTHAAGPANLILDESGYWRCYYRFGPNRISPAALKAQGEGVLGKTRFARLKRQTEKSLREKGVDPRAVDWRDHVFLAMHKRFTPVPAPPPPANWILPDFDDTSWVRQRWPFQSGRPAKITSPILGQFDESVDLRLQTMFYRTRFLVEDPRRAGPMTLRLVYSGGARVFLNGQEIARQDLPAGSLAPDTPATDYDAQAYSPSGRHLSNRVIGPFTVRAGVVRGGVNVLAIEIRDSHMHPVVLTNPRQPNWGGPQRPWPHARLSEVELRGNAPAVQSALRRPPGVRVWVEDIHHRVESTGFLPWGETAGTVRVVGVRNGTHSAQIAVGSDRELTGLRVQAGALVQVGGAARLPATAIRVLHMVPYPVNGWTIARLGDERGLSATFPKMDELARYARMEAVETAYLFDQLTNSSPLSIPANSCRPIWLSMRIPADAKSGHYRGALTVSAQGVSPVSLPIELEVVNWVLPDPARFQTFVGCEQNPYGVARQYGVRLWSNEHFRLLEASFRQLGRIGNKWLNVPVLANTEFGNNDDSMIRWIQTRDGTLTFDYAILDQYLDLARKHCGPPRTIQFIVMHGMKSPVVPPTPPQVKVFNEASGRTFLLGLGGEGTPAGLPQQAWRAFATSLYAHMKARGLEKSMYWGYPLEQEADPALKTKLMTWTPNVFWSAGPHEMMANGTFAKNEKFYKIVTDIRYNGGWRSFRDDRGWKSRTIHLLNPRVGGTAFALHTTSLPFAYRVLPDRALSMGRTGFTRVGVDEWASIHYDGMAIPKWLTGIPVLFTLWPGPNGAESSARFEAMLEGIQETEARIYIEQALDSGRLPQKIATNVRQVLSEHSRDTSFFQGNSIIHSLEQYHYGWQERSRRLYQAAAEVATLAGTRRGRNARQ